MRIRPPEHRSVGNGGMLEEQALDLDRRHLAGMDLDQILDPALHPNKAGLIDFDQVAGAKPAAIRK